MNLKDPEIKELAALDGSIKKDHELSTEERALLSIAESLIVIKNKLGRRWP